MISHVVINKGKIETIAQGNIWATLKQRVKNEIVAMLAGTLLGYLRYSHQDWAGCLASMATISFFTLCFKVALIFPWAIVSILP